MSFDLNALTDRVATEGKVARVLIVDVAGSSPREAGTSMLVWADGQSGTIGGGALEYAATHRARDLMQSGETAVVRRESLGPDLGQCCGGAVSLVFEVFDTDNLKDITNRAGIFARPVAGDASPDMPAALRRLLEQAEQKNTPIVPDLHSGWLAESLWHRKLPVWIWGGGHVGRALACTLAPLPQFQVSIIEDEDARLPNPMPQGVEPLLSLNPADLAQFAPRHAHHFIMTYSHQMDLDICHRLLGRGFAGTGLIGSKTKWARFRKRLQHLGHNPTQIDRIICPIGDPAMGKHPQAIAVSVTAGLLRATAHKQSAKDVA